MSKYYSFEEQTQTEFSSEVSPFILAPLDDLSCMETTILTSGNLVTEATPVTNWLKKQRINVIDNRNEIKSAIDKFDSERRAEYNNVKNYFQNNIFNNKQENENRLVPTSIVALSAFLTGRIMCRKRFGWSSVGNPTSISTKLIKSLPSRIITPWVFACTTFAIGTPETWNNVTKVISERYIPTDVSETVKNTSNSIYNILIKAPIQNINQFSEVTLPEAVKQIRKNFIELLQVS
ncbi:similar to Saccharomyces cerevisiae YNL100W AIM37 Putative protein of unknown function [Maudiozyma barnettii]|uniref:Uncharacterized protein n=1 Tax=Maudiozyma barnettii TaxID=61262 RepID=A0A8H2VC12_9SACH|nr:Mic27p [Kazachstania barnettii]CAB4252508.1 similar to Saccharomyces cerevisiae YNL100W AIM37 Putative protein of unknown function [Kazachstania barnettii]CAD1779242.1 similar to Saccharomyces cerevisiae YNL100W AIM37 Putative protein of unknown function [Kazachstania barnettii]